MRMLNRHKQIYGIDFLDNKFIQDIHFLCIHMNNNNFELYVSFSISHQKFQFSQFFFNIIQFTM